MAFEKMRSPDASQESKKQEGLFFRVFHNDKVRAEKGELSRDKNEANELLKDIQDANKTEKAREITEKGSKLDAKMLTKMLKNVPPERRKILDAALAYLGTNQHENPELIKKWNESAGVEKPGPDTAWCMSFVQHVLNNLGKQTKPTAWALNGLKIGKRVETGSPGDLVIVRRGEEGGHIGFFIGLSDSGKPIIIGGNQGSGEVSIKEETRPILGYQSIV